MLADPVSMGKLGVRSRQESGSGTLYWEQEQDAMSISTSLGPLGRGASCCKATTAASVLE